MRVGVQLAPQHTTYAAFARAVQEVEALGVDTIWNWDHFFPPFEYPQKGDHFEAWTLLAAMATLTTRAEIGCLVTCNSYRNPALLAGMARTVDHISGGRLILGLGAGWFKEEYREFGYEFGSPGERLQALEKSLIVIKERWAKDLPHPIRSPIPILLGGGGERVTLRLTAKYADMWNSGAGVDVYRHKSAILDDWCRRVGRDPSEIERTLNIYQDPDPAVYDDYAAAGVRHIILNLGSPWDLSRVEKLVQWRNSRTSML